MNGQWPLPSSGAFLCRRSDFDDADEIFKLFGESRDLSDPLTKDMHFEAIRSIYNIYPDITHIQKLIELSYLCITVENMEGSIVGFAAFDDSPQIFKCPQPFGVIWERWISESYGEKVAESVNPRNSLWLRAYFGLDDSPDLFREIQTSLFVTYPTINNICLMLPKPLSDINGMSSHLEFLHPCAFDQLEANFSIERGEDDLSGIRYERKSSGYVPHSSIVYVCHRLNIVQPLLIRRALVEDHDNLIEVFDAQSELKSTTHGEFFLAELIAMQDLQSQALVAEAADKRARGLVSVSTSVDISLLHETFDLEPYELLVKPDYFAKLRKRFLATAAAQEAAARGDYSKMHGADGMVDPLLYGYCPGDFFQHALLQIEGGIASIQSGSANGDEEPNTLLSVLEVLKHAALTEDVASQINLADAMELLLWHVDFDKPRLRSSDPVDVTKLVESSDMILSLMYDPRQKLGERLQVIWPLLEKVVLGITSAKHKRAEEIATAKRRAAQAAARAGPAGGPLSRVRPGSTDKRPGSPSGGDLESAEIDESTLDHVNILQVLQEWSVAVNNYVAQNPEYEGQQLGQVELATIIIAFHWWGGMSIESQDSIATWVEFEAALGKLLRSEEDNILLSFGNPAWLSYVPDEQRSCIGISLACLDAKLGTQAYDFLKPIFSLFPDKDYLVVTQKSSDPIPPLLSVFTPVPALPTSNADSQLFILHRATLFTPASVRMLKASDEDALDAFVSSSPNELQDEIFHAARVFLSNTQEMADLADRDYCLRNNPFFVAIVEDQIIAILQVHRLSPAEVEEFAAHHRLEDFCLTELHDYAAREVVSKHNQDNFDAAQALTGGTPTIPSFADPRVKKAAEALKDERGLSMLGINSGHFMSLGTCLFNPIFRVHQRFLLREVLRQTDATVFIAQTPVSAEIPDIVITDFVQVPPRKEARIRLIARDVISCRSFEGISDPNALEEHNPAKHMKPLQHRDLKLAELRRKTLTLSVLTKRMLAAPKEGIHSRIVVIGASDSGLGFLEELLNMHHLLFTRLTLVTPGGVSEIMYENGTSANTSLGAAFMMPNGQKLNQEDDSSENASMADGHNGQDGFGRRKLLNLPSSVMVNRNDLRRQLFGLRVRVIDARLVSIDRESHTIALSDGSLLAYDQLVLTAGLPEASLHDVKLRSWATDPVAVPDGYKTVNGAFSISDPLLPNLFASDSILIRALVWNPLAFCAIYGRTLGSFATAEALLKQGVPPYKIVLILPPRASLKLKWERYVALANSPSIRSSVQAATVVQQQGFGAMGGGYGNNKTLAVQAVQLQAITCVLVAMVFGSDDAVAEAKKQVQPAVLEAFNAALNKESTYLALMSDKTRLASAAARLRKTSVSASLPHITSSRSHSISHDNANNLGSGVLQPATLSSQESIISVRHPEKHSMYLPDNTDEETEGAIFEEGDPLEERILQLLIQRGARVLVDYKLVDVQEESIMVGGGAHGAKNNGMLSMLVGGGALATAQLLGNIGSGGISSNGGGGKLKRIILEDFTTLPDVAEALWKKREESIAVATQAALNEQSSNNNNRGGAIGAIGGGGSSNLPSLNPNAASNQDGSANANLNVREPFPGFDHPRLRSRRRMLKNKETEEMASVTGGVSSAKEAGAPLQRRNAKSSSTNSVSSIPELEDLMDLCSWSATTGRLHKRLLSRALICAGRRGVDPVIFEAAHGAGIVYDGRLVVDSAFRTADKNIHAGGSLCRFSNKYRSRPDQCLRLDHFNGREVGTGMAHQVLKSVDPIFGTAPCPKYADHRWIREVGAVGRTYHTESVSIDPLQRSAQGTLLKKKRNASEVNNSGMTIVNGTLVSGVSKLEEPIVEGAVRATSDTAAAGRQDPKNADDGLYVFSQPIVQYAVLPGGLHFVTGRVCASQVDNDAMEIEEVLETDCLRPATRKKGEAFSSSQSVLEGHFTRVEILKDGRVGRFSILGQETIAPEAVDAIVGMPSTLLNHLRTRVKDGDIPDILEFLSDEWSTAIWFDNFANFFTEIKKDIISDPACRQQIAQAVRGMSLKSNEAIGLDRLHNCIEDLLGKSNDNSLKSRIDAHVMNYLRRIQPHLKWHQAAGGANGGESSGLGGNSSFHQQAMGSIYFLPEEWTEAWKTLHM